MKTKESKELSDNAANTIVGVAGIVAILILFSTISGCVQEIGRQITHNRDTAAMLQAMRYQMGIVEGNEHSAR